MESKMNNKYYVYKVFLNKEVIYVGKGQGSRSSHVLSGKSHNSKLNEYYFRHKLLGEDLPFVKKVRFFEEEEEALNYETYLIKDLLPDCNVRGTKIKKEIGRKRGKKTQKRKDTVKKFKITKEVTKKVPKVQEDVTIDLPDNYEDFYQHMESLYKDYIKQSSSENPHPLKWFCYSKKVGKRWQKYIPYLDKMFSELDKEDKLNPSKVGRKQGFPAIFNLTSGEKTAFYRMQKKLEGYLDPDNEEDYVKAEKWLEEYRTVQ